MSTLFKVVDYYNKIEVFLWNAKRKNILFKFKLKFRRSINNEVNSMNLFIYVFKNNK